MRNPNRVHGHDAAQVGRDIVTENEMPAFPKSCEVVVIGAGFSGLCAAIKLSKAGSSFAVLEREEGLGGVWRQNTYPGAACDVASALYSFSFENDYDWPRTHGSYQDIVTYMKYCTDKYAVDDRLFFGTDVQSLSWNVDSELWSVQTNKGVLTAKFVISACGLFSKPTLPHTEGLDSFKGDVIHSAMWNHDFDPRGKTIAVVGNGCSAAQIVPAIVEETEKIYLTMRSPVHVMAKAERTYSNDERELYRRFPLLRALDRQNFIGKSLELAVLPMSAQARDQATPPILEIMSGQLTDARKREAVLPDYPVMAKRPIRSDAYLPALDRDNVEILRTTIDHLSPDAMTMVDGRTFEIDAIVFATGFEASQYLVPLEVYGLKGNRLHDAWKDGAHAYYGMLVPNFPNFLMIYGPNTNVVGSILQIIEPQVEIALSLIEEAKLRRARIEVAAEVEESFNQELQERLGHSIWGQNTATSYFTAKSGRIVTQWPGTFVEFQERLSEIDLSEVLVGTEADNFNAMAYDTQGETT